MAPHLFFTFLSFPSVLYRKSPSLFPIAAAELPTADAIEAASFMDAVSLASTVCEALVEVESSSASSPALSSSAAASLIPSFLTSSDGARGWFVSSLSDPRFRSAALSPAVPRAIVAAIASAPDPPTYDLPRLMVMNVIMPLATAIAHESTGNTDGAAASLETFDRATALIKQTSSVCRQNNVSIAKAALKADLTTIAVAASIAKAGWEETNEGESSDNAERLKFWISFMEKWQYQGPQKQAIYTIAAKLSNEL